MAIDHVLKLYAETIRSPYLHYGYWDEPEKVNVDSLSIDNIANAQGRYIEHLTSFIPEDVRSILDVGCGVGGNAAYLQERGFDIDVLSPDPYQEKVIKKKFNGAMQFFKSKFENFETDRTYDLILESESACYIKIEPGFTSARRALRTGGYLLVADYFVYYRNERGSPHLKSSHSMQAYLKAGEAAGFKLLKEYDQTENTMPTLDAAYNFIKRFILPTAEYTQVSLQRKNPLTYQLMKSLFGKKLSGKMDQLDLVKSEEFRKYRKYMIYLFQKI